MAKNKEQDNGLPCIEPLRGRDSSELGGLSEPKDESEQELEEDLEFLEGDPGDTE